MTSLKFIRLAGLGTVSAAAMAVGIITEVCAQAALPPVVVQEPTARRANTPAVRRAVRPARVVAPRPVVRAPVADRPAPFVENPRGPIRGYVAGRSLAGTKTNTPINETPQSISVIGAEQIRDQKIVSQYDETLRYTPGVVGGTFGADTRNDWFLIRGFSSQSDGNFLDGLQLFETAFATWKLQPFNLERVEVLRGPSAILYGGTGPGGIVNAVSKLPPAAPIRYIEAGVNNFGNAYVGFDFGGPVATAPGNGQVLTRVVGQVQGGGTQVNFVNNDNYFIAPSVTWLPDIDTRFTVLAQASYNKTRGKDFLPYVGTVTPAPYGRIPTSMFTSDPNIDKFERQQVMLGYQFERNLTDDMTLRQNARVAYVNVKSATLFGLGYTTTPAAADLSRGLFTVDDEATQAQIDTTLEYRFATGPVLHKTLFGVDLKHYGISDFQTFGSAPSLNLANGTTTPPGFPFSFTFADRSVSQRQAAVYAQDQMKLGGFTLVLSGRNDFVDTTNDNRLATNQSREDSKFSGRAGLIYNFDSGVAPYASYATSYNPVIGVNGATGNLLLPETGVQTEVGVKYKPIAFIDAQFGIALFDLKRQNALTVNPNNVLLTSQNGEITSRGIELEAVANLQPGFKIVGAFTAYNLFISRDLNPALVGTVPTATPRQTASLWGDYTFQDGWLRGFGFGGGVRYVGASFADTANSLLVPSVVLGDAAVHYEFDGWRLALNALNVADTTYVSTCSSASACFYGNRRRVTASVGYRW